MKLANRIYNSVPKDGGVLGVFSSSAAMVPLYSKRKAKFVTSNFEWIAGIHSGIMTCGVWKGAGQDIKTLPDFIADGKKIKTTLRPMRGEDVAAAFAEFYKTPRALVDKTYEMTITKKNPRKKK